MLRTGVHIALLRFGVLELSVRMKGGSKRAVFATDRKDLPRSRH
jgi:hypothetical protein